MFDFAEATKSMTATEILNYYRNLYYTESQVTERGIVANAINELLPNITPVAHGEWIPYSVTMMGCSACKRHTARHRFEYCPHCGTKMDGGIHG